jgi:hypothetical protein
MSTILKKIAEFLRLKRPEQSGMARMMEMDQQEHHSNDMAAIPAEMEMTQGQHQERQMRGHDNDM